MKSVVTNDLPAGISQPEEFHIATGLNHNPVNNVSAYLGMKLPVASAHVNGTGFMLNEAVKYTANTGIALISTANSNLDGTGTVVSFITGASSGTLIKSITIKALGTPARGMVRIFLKVSSSYWLLREIPVNAIGQTSVDRSFFAMIDENFFLKPGYILAASTQNADSFVVTAEGLDMTYPF